MPTQNSLSSALFQVLSLKHCVSSLKCSISQTNFLKPPPSFTLYFKHSFKLSFKLSLSRSLSQAHSFKHSFKLSLSRSLSQAHSLRLSLSQAHSFKLSHLSLGDKTRMHKVTNAWTEIQHSLSKGSCQCQINLDNLLSTLKSCSCSWIR